MNEFYSEDGQLDNNYQKPFTSNNYRKEKKIYTQEDNIKTILFDIRHLENMLNAVCEKMGITVERKFGKKNDQVPF